MKEKQLSKVHNIVYNVEGELYEFSRKSIQLAVFQQIQKDANMVGQPFDFSPDETINKWYESLQVLLTNQLMHGDIRSFLYRIDVSEQKIRQIDQLSVDDLCILVLEREFKKVVIRKHFSPK
jgi:hypothetical protein